MNFGVIPSNLWSKAIKIDIMILNALGWDIRLILKKLYWSSFDITVASIQCTVWWNKGQGVQKWRIIYVEGIWFLF